MASQQENAVQNAGRKARQHRDKMEASKPERHAALQCRRKV